MKTLRQELLSQIARALYSPQLLSESFSFEGKKYDIAYERADDDNSIKFTAFDGPHAVAVLELKAPG